MKNLIVTKKSTENYSFGSFEPFSKKTMKSMNLHSISQVSVEFSLFVLGYHKNISTTGLLLDNNPDLELVSTTMEIFSCVCVLLTLFVFILVCVGLLAIGRYCLLLTILTRSLFDDYLIAKIFSQPFFILWSTPFRHGPRLVRKV